MKHLMLADKSLLIGDEAAVVLMEYATLIGRVNTAVTVDLRGINPDGNDVVFSVMLSSGLNIITETAHSLLPEPDNSAATDAMRAEIELAKAADDVSPEEITGTHIWNQKDDPWAEDRADRRPEA